LLSVFSYFFSGAQNAAAKFIEIIWFSSFAIFHVYLIQIYFKSKYLKKLLIFGFEY